MGCWGCPACCLASAVCSQGLHRMSVAACLPHFPRPQRLQCPRCRAGAQGDEQGENLPEYTGAQGPLPFAFHCQSTPECAPLAAAPHCTRSTLTLRLAARKLGALCLVCTAMWCRAPLRTSGKHLGGWVGCAGQRVTDLCAAAPTRPPTRCVLTPRAPHSSMLQGAVHRGEGLWLREERLPPGAPSL